MSQLMSGEAKNQNIPGLDIILRGEVMRKDGLVRQLMEQNKMLLTTRERQEVEMQALNETLEVSGSDLDAIVQVDHDVELLGAKSPHPDPGFSIIQRSDKRSQAGRRKQTEGRLRRKGQTDDKIAGPTSKR